MKLKIENPSNIKLPRRTEEFLSDVLDTIPREHLRGIERVRFVETISDPRLRGAQTAELPGLYHPRQGTQSAWFEISAGVLLKTSKPALQRLLPKLSFKGNLAAVLFSLAAQHYHLTLKHSVKRSQLEPNIRAYADKYLKAWHARQHSFRSRLFKPLQPTFERWAKSLQKQAAKQKKIAN